MQLPPARLHQRHVVCHLLPLHDVPLLSSAPGAVLEAGLAAHVERDQLW